MARPLRLEFSGALYHVTSRGDRREDIFLDDDDRMSYGDYPSVALRAGSAQLTPSPQPASGRGRERGMADERTKAPYNQQSPVPEKYRWPGLISAGVAVVARGLE